MGQAQNDSNSAVDVLEFVARQQTVRFAQAALVYSANLFDQHASSRAVDLYFRPERGSKRPRTARGARSRKISPRCT